MNNTITNDAEHLEIKSYDDSDLWRRTWFRNKLIESLARDGFGDQYIAALRKFFLDFPQLSTFDEFQSTVKNLPDRDGKYQESLLELSAYWQGVRETNESVYNPKNSAEFKQRFWPNNLKLLQTDWDRYEDLYTAQIGNKHHRFITRNTLIASAGSCFAANIAIQLQHWGYKYIVEMKPSDSTGSATPITDFAGIGNIYNAMSMRQMIERGFGYWRPEKILMFKQPGLWDPFRYCIDYATYEEFLAKYEEHNQALRRALEKCDVFILTLGLSEAWVLADSGIALVGAPRRCDSTLMRTKNLSVGDNVYELERLYEIFKKHNPKVKIIITVSPVPLNATYNIDRHVVEANGLSKATLRVAAEEFTRAHLDDVFYFPAYELVTTATRNPWQADLRHVSFEAVSRVMKQFQYSFFVDQTELDIAPIDDVEDAVETRRNYFLKYGRKWIVHPLKRKLGIEGRSFNSLLRR